MPSLFLSLLILLMVLCPLPDLEAKATTDDYAGASACLSCHKTEYKQWQSSDHHKAMQLATADSVLGDFSGKTVHFHAIESRLYRKENRFLIDTLDQSGTTKTFEIKYTFGFYPLQQYLIELDDGFIQALNIAWDCRPIEQGGQRWFHLQPDEKITPEHPFFWDRHFQNWNSRCADCHSTNLSQNYDADLHRFETTWSEINVSCAACHGSGSEHIALANSKKLSPENTGFSHSPKQPLQWIFKPGDPIAHPQGKKNADEINMCGSCHALRTQLTEASAGQIFHDSNRIQLLEDGLYFPDGQIREEVFVLGSFLQSKMFEKGVTCSDCHNPHSGKLRIPGNGLCLQCHDSQTFDTPKHHHHTINTPGAACVSCHMPTRTYMQVDDRRDHSFTIPRPGLSQELGVPNACMQCHVGETVEGEQKDHSWASQELLKWGVEPNNDHWAFLNQRALIGDVLVTRALTNEITQSPISNLVRASLLQQLAGMPSRVSAETAKKSLRDESPMVRRAAVTALQAMPPSLRWQLLSPHLKDPSRSVRFEIAANLADILNQLPPAEQPDLAALIEEYRASLHISASSPVTQSAIATLEMQLGNLDAAEKAYLQALRIEPNYVPALINLADHYRGTNREKKVEHLLKQALQIAPDSGGAHHSYGLFLIRKQNYDKALPHLMAAVKQTDAQSRYAYVYALALDRQGQTEKAIETLKAAATRWPNQYDLLMILVNYLDKTGDTKSALTYLSALSKIAPASPEVKRLIQKHQQ
ncbi:MAG: tetratricopeptide repeat protein [Opitutaceae bacterium]|nr:tetratricopeptide repeat protein [Opitutaceae bacterium]